MKNAFRKIIFSTLIVASIGGICYGAWYGLGKWGYDKVSTAYFNLYQKSDPELVSLLNESKNLPVKMTGFPFSWRFELDSAQSEKTKAFFSKMVKVLSEKRRFTNTPRTENEMMIFNQLIKKTNLDGQFNIGWRSLWSPHPWQSQLQLSFGPFRSFMIHVKGKAQGNSKKINTQIFDIDLVKDEETLISFKANYAIIQDNHANIDIKGKVDHKVGDHIAKHIPAFITGLLKNTLLPFDFSISMRTTSWDHSYAKGVFEGDCDMTFKDKTLSCHFDMFVEANQETGAVEKFKFQAAFPKQKVLELFEKMGLPPLWSHFFMEKEDKLIFKVEKDGEKIMMNERPFKN